MEYNKSNIYGAFSAFGYTDGSISRVDSSAKEGSKSLYIKRTAFPQKGIYRIKSITEMDSKDEVTSTVLFDGDVIGSIATIINDCLTKTEFSKEEMLSNKTGDTMSFQRVYYDKKMTYEDTYCYDEADKLFITHDLRFKRLYDNRRGQISFVDIDTTSVADIGDVHDVEKHITENAISKQLINKLNNLNNLVNLYLNRSSFCGCVVIFEMQKELLIEINKTILEIEEKLRTQSYRRLLK